MPTLEASNLSRKPRTDRSTVTFGGRNRARSNRDTDTARVRIEYCVPGNHAPTAHGLAAAIHGATGCAVELVPSRDGVFEVEVDGRLVFSKRASWRFPDHDEILYHVSNR